MTDARRAILAASLAALLTGAGIGFAGPAQAAVTVPVAQVRSNQWWLDKLAIEQAWPASHEGAGVKVGVLDTGVDGQNIDLRGAVIAGKDFSGKGSANGQTPVATDTLGSSYHGTGMAALIAGRGHGTGNGQGMIGVAPKASIITASDDLTDPATTSRAMRYLVDSGAKVINLSITDVEMEDAVAYAQAHDVVVVAGAGNRPGQSPGVPANYMGVVDVAGVDKDLTPDPGSSSGGPGIAGGDSLPPGDSANGVAVVGPMADVPGDGTDLEGDGTNTNGLVGPATRTTYTRGSGTSNATAVVSGIVALIRAAHPQMNAANVVNQLGRFAQHPGKTGSNYSGEYGFGVPNAYKSVTKVLPTACENPFGSVAEPQSFGLWKSLADKTKYVPKCTGTPSTSPSTGNSDSIPSPSSGSPTVGALPSNSSSSSGVPVWVWPVVAVVVLGAAGLIVATRRSRRAATHGQPPSN